MVVRKAHAIQRPRSPVGHPEVEVVVEIPKWSFLKRGSTGKIDFVSPFPCPFNYGSIPQYVGLEGDLLDALVLGPRLPRGSRVKVQAHGAIGLSERGMYDDKIVASHEPLGPWQVRAVLLFFHFYAVCKGLLNFFRGYRGYARCEGWGRAEDAIKRAKIRDETWAGPDVPF